MADHDQHLEAQQPDGPGVISADTASVPPADIVTTPPPPADAPPAADTPARPGIDDLDPAPTPPGDRSPGVNWMQLALTSALALACGAAGAWGFERFGPKPPPPAEVARRGPAEPAPPAKKAEEPKAEPRGGSDLQLKGRLDALDRQIEGLQARVTANSADELRVGLNALRERVDGLESKANTNAAATAKVDSFDDRINGLAKSLESLRDDVAAVEDSQKPGRSDDGSGTATTRHTVARPASNASNGGDGDSPSLQRAGRLFNDARYADALDVLRRLQKDEPDDARVWYYSALANGFSTGKWTGDTQKLAEKGVEREKAGTPNRPVIDAEFAHLTKSSGRDWLDFYRNRAHQ